MPHGALCPWALLLTSCLFSLHSPDHEFRGSRDGWIICFSLHSLSRELLEPVCWEMHSLIPQQEQQPARPLLSHARHPQELHTWAHLGTPGTCQGRKVRSFTCRTLLPSRQRLSLPSENLSSL